MHSLQKTFSGYALLLNKQLKKIAELLDNYSLLHGFLSFAKLIDHEISRNKKTSKVRYIVEQYFGLSHLHNNAKRERFTDITKNKFDDWYRQAVFNISRSLKIWRMATV